MSAGIIATIAAVVTVIGILGFVAWWSVSWPNFNSCVQAHPGDPNCLTGMITSSPPIKEVTDLKDACNQTDMNCIAKLAEIAAKEKLQKAADEKK